MGKVVVVEHLTLDGVMQAPGNPDEDTRGGFQHGGWANKRQDPVMQQVIGASMSQAWALLAGRRTYEDLLSYWPGQAPNPISEVLDRVHKYVASSTLTEPLEWRNSTLLEGDVITAVARLKQELEENLVVFGSAELTRSLMAGDLVDEFILLFHPLVFGSGLRLFPDSGSALAELQLVDSRTTDAGVIIATYRRER